MDKVNERQVGGSHYRTSSGRQHWDVVEDFGIGYLEGIATGYICRWKQKAGAVDLEKAVHCIDKLISLANRREQVRRPRGFVNADALDQFFRDYPMGKMERMACTILFTWNRVEGLVVAREATQRAYEDAKRAEEEQSSPQRPLANGQDQPFGYDHDAEFGGR